MAMTEEALSPVIELQSLRDSLGERAPYSVLRSECSRDCLFKKEQN